MEIGNPVTDSSGGTPHLPAALPAQPRAICSQFQTLARVTLGCPGLEDKGRSSWVQLDTVQYLSEDPALTPASKLDSDLVQGRACPLDLELPALLPRL